MPLNNGLDRHGPKGKNAGPLEDLEGNKFITDYLTYPKDIETLAHAMLFNINVSEHSHDITKGSETVVQGETASRSMKLRKDTILGHEVKAGGGIGAIGTQRKTKRIQKAITMYVPETMIFDNKQDYYSPYMLSTIGAASDIILKAGGAITKGSLTGMGALAGAATDGPLGAIVGALGGFAIGKILDLAASGAGSAIRNATEAFGDPSGGNNQMLTEFTGYAVNPVIEVVYGTPKLRQFQFDFNFAPSSSDEADNIWKIIQTFRYFQAPAVETSGFAGILGAFFIPPAEFDITFLKQTSSGSFVQNNNIPGISTCVLEEINVNYTPENQWTTHKDGFPTHVQMRLMFTEIDIMHADRIAEGF